MTFGNQEEIMLRQRFERLRDAEAQKMVRQFSWYYGRRSTGNLGASEDFFAERFKTLSEKDKKM